MTSVKKCALPEYFLTVYLLLLPCGRYQEAPLRDSGHVFNQACAPSTAATSTSSVRKSILHSYTYALDGMKDSFSERRNRYTGVEWRGIEQAIILENSLLPVEHTSTLHRTFGHEINIMEMRKRV